MSLPWSACRICGYRVDSATQLDDPKAVPQPGDLTVCLNCGAVSAFDEALLLREPTDAEREQIDDQALSAITYIRARGRFWPRPGFELER